MKAPSFGERRKNYLQDIAIATGSTYIAEEVGLTLDQVPKLKINSMQAAASFAIMEREGESGGREGIDNAPKEERTVRSKPIGKRALS